MNAPIRAGDHVSHPHIKTELPGPKARAMIARDTMVGTQFHPEKSGDAGLILLRNWFRSIG